MKEVLAKSGPKQQFFTFLIKEDKTGKKGLWFVMIFVPSMKNFTILKPVWRKIKDGGKPDNLGSHGPFKLGGDVILLGEDDSRPKEKLYVEQVRKDGEIPFVVSAGTDAFGSDRESFFNFLLSTDTEKED